MKIFQMMLIALLTAPLFAGGPLSLGPGRVPTTWDPAQPVEYSVESGPLNEALDNTAAAAMVHAEFADWQTVAGSLLTIKAGPNIADDIQTLDELETQVVFQRRQPIIFDETGSLFEEFGADANVLAFTSVDNQGSDFYNVAFVIFGGPAMSNFSNDHVSSIMLHEFGHFLGLGHSVVNGDLRAFGDSLPGFGRVPEDAVEIMYWSINPNDPSGGVHQPKQDDISAFLGSYSNHPQGRSGTAAVAGSVKDSDGASDLRGVGIVARDLSGGAETAYHNAAGAITGVGEEGAFHIGGLPAGSYNVQTYDLGFRNDGAYWDPGIRTNNEGNPTRRNLGPFPGEEEFYNGANESNDPLIDDPSEATTIELTVDQTTSGIDLIANRSPDVKGSTLEFIHILPEVQANDEDRTTVIGIVNTGDFEQTLDIYGFTASGLALPKSDIVESIPPKAKAWFSVRQAYPAASDSVSWLQIGATAEMMVFAELRDTDTRSAYWSSTRLSDQTFMPHIASDTSSFETKLSVVNASQDGVESKLTLQPSGIDSTLTALGDPYSTVSDPLTELFGDAFDPNIWGLLTAESPVLAASESFTTLPDRKMSAALGLNSQSGRTLRFLHVATDVGQFWTGLVYINVSDLTAQIQETFYNAAGEVLSTNSSELTAGGKVTLLFDAQNQERVPAGTSWVEVSADRELIGYELFGTPAGVNNDTFTGLQGSYSQGRILDYPHMISTNERFTAIVAVNVGDSTADLNLTVYNRAGTALETVTLPNLAPKTKVARLVRDLGLRADTRAAGHWIRAQASGSSFAGFALWGDQGGDNRHFLSGVTSTSRADNLSLEIEPNNVYSQAQVLTADSDGWDVRLVGEISRSDSGEIINTNGGDDIEDIYTFTLTQPTELVIAVAPDNPVADLDLFIFNDQFGDGPFFSVDPASHPQITFSANAGGDESIAQVFEPGTYYIMVTLFEIDAVSATEYGLVVQEKPLVLETFESQDALADWTAISLNTDTNGVANMHLSNVLVRNNEGLRFGSSLFFEAPNQGDTEGLVLYSPFFDVPSTGVTLFECAMTHVSEGTGTDPRMSMAIVDEAQNVTAPDARIPSVITPVPISFGTEQLTWLRWQSWIGYAGGLVNADRANHTTAGHEGQRVAIGLQTVTNRDKVFFDNVRAVNIKTSATASKRDGSRVVSRKRKLPQRRYPNHTFKLVSPAKR